MIRLMGLNAGEDIDIVYTGLRPGEKIHEELVSHSEEIEKTLHEKIMLVKTSSVEWQSFREKIDELFSDMNALDLNKMRNMLAAMISENEVN
jgi:FlaA1/EpsC-like NDP-sugar epimerase